MAQNDRIKSDPRGPALLKRKEPDAQGSLPQSLPAADPCDTSNGTPDDGNCSQTTSNGLAPTVSASIRAPDRFHSTDTRDAGFEGLGNGLFLAAIFVGLGIWVLSVSWPCGLVLFVAAAFCPLIGILLRKGPCPYCGNELLVIPGSKGITCGACQKRTVYRDDKLHRVD